MAHHPSLKAKAIEWRRRENLTIDQLAERLALSRTTIYYWVKDIPIERRYDLTPARRAANRRNSAAYKKKRDAAYAQGVAEFEDLCRIPDFRDFVCMYIGEGYKRCRNTVSLANSDPTVIALADVWIAHFAINPVWYSVQYHADQNLKDLVAFWSAWLSIRPEQVRLLRKSNSSGLATRKWRCRYGVLTVGANDTLLRSRLQGWIDCVKKDWV